MSTTPNRASNSWAEGKAKQLPWASLEKEGPNGDRGLVLQYVKSHSACRHREKENASSGHLSMSFPLANAPIWSNCREAHSQRREQRDFRPRQRAYASCRPQSWHEQTGVNAGGNQSQRASPKWDQANWKAPCMQTKNGSRSPFWFSYPASGTWCWKCSDPNRRTSR